MHFQVKTSFDRLNELSRHALSCFVVTDDMRCSNQRYLSFLLLDHHALQQGADDNIHGQHGGSLREFLPPSKNHTTPIYQTITFSIHQEIRLTICFHAHLNINVNLFSLHCSYYFDSLVISFFMHFSSLLFTCLFNLSFLSIF